MPLKKYENEITQLPVSLCYLLIYDWLFIAYARATQLILTKVQSERFSISRGAVEFLTCSDKNKTIITSKYRKILGFSHSLH